MPFFKIENMGFSLFIQLFWKRKKKTPAQQKTMGGSFRLFALESVDLILEYLGSLEHGGVAGGDVDRFAVCGIAALAGITMLAGESAETEECNGLMRGEGIHDGVENAVHNSRCLLLGQFVFCCDFLDQFCFVHYITLLFINEKVFTVEL